MNVPISDLQEAIAEALSEEKAYDLPKVCEFYGLDPQEKDDPFHSKRIYVRSRLKNKPDAFLIELGVKVKERYHSEKLEILLQRIVGGGVTGEVKNLIFAANRLKPEIVLIDAVNNTIDIVENAEYCLVYDEPISQNGLLWSDLVAWWSKKDSYTNLVQAEQHLYSRLKDSINSKVEELLFYTYYKEFRQILAERLPALIPQVYLHYDPKTLKELQGRRRIPRQRMDFLILFSSKDRVVLEVDGKQHYAKGDVANPQEYARMVSEDRRLRLLGYEVYRFGGYELAELDKGKGIVANFFMRLFEKHSIAFE
ncbi:MAG TPA: hypothetical protein VEP90_02870 [Methylomirabilota bacterium]|nr:hypothetical protein [Methylomirabilota bacterium]